MIRLKSIIILMMSVALLALTTSCVKEEEEKEKVKVTVAYHSGIIEVNKDASPEDVAKLKNYLSSLGFSTSTKIESYESTVKKMENDAEYFVEMDKRAKMNCDSDLAKFRAADIRSLGLDDAFSFRWGWYRQKEFHVTYTDPTPNDWHIIGDFRWNMD